MDVIKYIFSVLVAVTVIYCIQKILKWRSVLKRVAKLPGPKKLPVLGNCLDLLRCDNVQLFSKFREWSKKYSPVYAFTALGLHVVVITGAEEFEAITAGTKNMEKGIQYTLVEPWLGKGLLTSTGKHWQQRRKILTPAFHFSILQQFIKVFNKESAKLVEVLKEECKKQSTDIVPLMSQSALNTIAETSFGTKLDVTNKDDRNYISAIHSVGKILIYRLARPWLHSEVLFNLLSSVSVQFRNAVEVLHRFTNRIISEREKQFKPFAADPNEDSFGKKRLAFLDLLLNAKISNGTIDDDGIRDEVNTFMFEGHDTTATAISWILRQLAIHNNYQDLIYNEIISVLGDSQKEPELNDLNEMKLMERFIKETLRLFPSVPFISRKLDNDMVLAGHDIPKEVIVDIWIYDIHRNPKYWPEPEKFDPDRFLPENSVDRHPFAFIPFSAGPRNCIGQKFAMLELKSMLCGIVKNFILETVDKPDEIQIMVDLVLRNAGPISLKFKPRKV